MLVIAKGSDEKEAGETSSRANQKVLRNVRARVFEISKARNPASPDPLGVSSNIDPPKSTTLPEEPFESLAQQGKIIEPPFDLMTLAMLIEHSSELGPCIEAMETNIDGFGHRFVPRLKQKIGKDGEIVSGEDPLFEEAAQELAFLKNFFEYATEESFTAFRRKLRRDLELTGNYYFEVLRGQNGGIYGFVHIPSYQVRLGRLDEDPVLVDRKISVINSNLSVEIKTRKEYRRFRRFAQARSIHRGRHHMIEGHKVRWFKQFGDPRILNKNTGEWGDDNTPLEDRAGEIVHGRIYSARSPYGLPRFVGNLLSIFGDRAAEEINYITFRNNNIPSMVVLVSNGQLSQGSINRIEEFVQSQIQGSDNYSKFLLLEGEPYGEEEGEDGGQVKIDIKPLTSDQHKDALFQNYSANNQDKIRRVFRLPPIFVGRADDYSRATADSSRRLADEQIFAPERLEFDELINRTIFPEMGIRYHKFKSNNPNTTDSAALVKVLAGAEKTGGMTPRIARQVIQEILSQELPEFPEDFPADWPFSLTMAEAVKNKADPAEPGQQVTAIKTLKALGILDDDMESLEIEEDDAIETVVKKLEGSIRLAEIMWEKKKKGLE